ncbi:MAG: hypothetical protein SOS98_02930 [Varibaculum sp.]|nr:hypothetical protein [Varibaculum sp.]
MSTAAKHAAAIELIVLAVLFGLATALFTLPLPQVAAAKYTYTEAPATPMPTPVPNQVVKQPPKSEKPSATPTANTMKSQEKAPVSNPIADSEKTKELADTGEELTDSLYTLLFSTSLLSAGAALLTLRSLTPREVTIRC